MRATALAALCLLAAGCASPYHYEGLDGAGCSSTNRDNQSLLICSAGCTANDDVICKGTCSAEWRGANGTTLYRNTIPCGEESHDDSVFPFSTGESLHWVIYGRPGGGADCRLTLTYPGGAQWSIQARCLTLRGGNK